MSEAGASGPHVEETAENDLRLWAVDEAGLLDMRESEALDDGGVRSLFQMRRSFGFWMIFGTLHTVDRSCSKISLMVFSYWHETVSTEI